jgi:hypothetical protein
MTRTREEVLREYAQDWHYEFGTIYRVEDMAARIAALEAEVARVAAHQQPGEPVAWDRERILIILSEVVARWSMAGDDYRGRQEAYAWGVNALTLPHPRPRVGVTEVSECVPEYVNNALASLAKAWPVLAQHADHIDGEFSNALDTVKRYVERAHAPLANGGGEVARG